MPSPFAYATRSRQYGISTSSHCQRRISRTSGGHSIVIQLALWSPLAPGQPDIITTRSTPIRLASLIVLRVTASWRRPCSPGCNGLPEQLSALIAMPCSARRALKLLRSASLSSIRSRSRCGADDQLPQPNSSMSSSSLAAVATSVSKSVPGRLSVIIPIFIAGPSPTAVPWRGAPSLREHELHLRADLPVRSEDQPSIPHARLLQLAFRVAADCASGRLHRFLCFEQLA